MMMRKSIVAAALILAMAGVPAALAGGSWYESMTGKVMQAPKTVKDICWMIYASGASTATITGTQPYLVPRDGYTITSALASVYTTGDSAGTTGIKIRRVRDGVSVDVGVITIAVHEHTGTTSSFNNSALLSGDLIFIDCTGVTSATPARGLSVTVTIKGNN